MEQDNFQDFLKASLKGLEVTPSSQGREKLKGMLEGSKRKKKTISKIWWPAAAVLVVGLFFIGTNLVKDDLAPLSQPQFATEKKNSLPSVEGDSSLQIAESPQKAETSSAIKAYERKDMLASDRKDKIVQIKMGEMSNTLIDQSFENTLQKLPESHQKRQDGQLADIDEGVYRYVTPEDLLASMEQDDTIILKRTEQPITEPYIQSDMLLTKLEGQLFEEKTKNIFKKASKHIKNVKESVAQRNYE